MYLASAIFKHSARTPRHPVDVSPWVRGDALRHSLACCYYLTWWGDQLRQHHALCTYLTWLTLIIEYVVPVLLWLPNG